MHSSTIFTICLYFYFLLKNRWLFLVIVFYVNVRRLFFFWRLKSQFLQADWSVGSEACNPEGAVDKVSACCNTDMSKHLGYIFASYLIPVDKQIFMITTQPLLSLQVMYNCKWEEGVVTQWSKNTRIIFLVVYQVCETNTPWSLL